MNPKRNRLLIDYANFLTAESWLLPRTSGAPFIGEGEHYFSVVDDIEIEVLKALWEGEDYLRIPPPRRLWNCDWFDRQSFYNLAQLYVELYDIFKDSTSNTLQISVLGRGTWLLIAALAKPWKRIEVFQHYSLALKALVTYCGKRPELAHIQDLLVVDQGGLLDCKG